MYLFQGLFYSLKTHFFILTYFPKIINLWSTFSGVQWSSPFQLSKTVDNGSVIGTGVNHLVSTHHLETRMSVFKALHEQHIKYLPNEEKAVAR